MKSKQTFANASAPLDAKKSVHAETQESAETNSSLKDLLQQARAESTLVDNEIASHEKSSEEAANRVDQAAWSLVRLMLEIAETFEDADGSFNDAAFEAFLVKNGATRHPNIKNPMQPLAKICCPDSKRPLVTKRGQVLTALWNRKVRSCDVMDELQKSEPIGPKDAPRTGMARLLLLYRQDQRTKPTAATSKTSAATEDDIAAEDNCFDGWDDARVMSHAQAVIAECRKRNLDINGLMPGF